MTDCLLTLVLTKKTGDVARITWNRSPLGRESNWRLGLKISNARTPSGSKMASHRGKKGRELILLAQVKK